MIDRVQCGECLKFRITSFKEPDFAGTGTVKYWVCRVCGHRGPAIGRERLYTINDFGGGNGRTTRR